MTFFCVGCVAAHAQAQLRVVSYNLLDKPASLIDQTTISHLNAVFGAIATDQTNGVAKRPDILFLSEQTAQSPANLATILNNLYGVTSYTSVIPNSPESQGSNDLIAYVYDTASVSISSAPTALPITSNYPRPTVRAGFRPVGYSGAASDLYVYGMHTKASNTAADALQRSNQTLAARANADSELPAGSNIIYAGDFNVYTANEQGYRNLFAAGNGQAADPIDQSYNSSGAAISWSNNAAYASIHTQSTRTTTLSDGGATGGVDDRFDFQLVSTAMMDGNGISYIGPTVPDSGTSHSYKAFGNNGTTFNRSINDPLNTSKPAAVLNGLFNLSDHLPVVADYQLPAKMSVAVGNAPANVIAGAVVQIDVTIANSANVSSVFGADALDFSVTASHSIEGTQQGSVRATHDAAHRTMTVNTADNGSKLVQVQVTSHSEAVADGTFSTTIPITVFAPAQPSLSSDGILTSGTVDLGIVAIGSTVSGRVDVHNRPVVGPTAGLDLDAASLTGSTRFSSGFVPVADIAAGASTPVSFSFTPTLSLMESATLSIQTSDEDLPGASARATLDVNLIARGAYAGDANLSDSVDFDDLLILAQNYSSALGTWFTGDFDRDEVVGFDDLLALAQNYGLNALNTSPNDFAADWALARSIVPEPTSLMTVALLSLALRRDRRMC